MTSPAASAAGVRRDRRQPRMSAENSQEDRCTAWDQYRLWLEVQAAAFKICRSSGNACPIYWASHCRGAAEPLPNHVSGTGHPPKQRIRTRPGAWRGPDLLGQAAQLAGEANEASPCKPCETYQAILKALDPTWGMERPSPPCLSRQCSWHGISTWQAKTGAIIQCTTNPTAGEPQ